MVHAEEMQDAVHEEHGDLVGGEDLEGHQWDRSVRSYACTMSCTILWRTTSRPVRRMNARPSMPCSTRSRSSSPLRPPGTSIWVTSPVTTTREPNPMRVRN